MHSVVLITGATGFIGSHVVHQALDAGYIVKVTSRPGKVDALRALYFGQKVEVFCVPDIATGDFTEALKGVNAVIHIAAPLPIKDSAENMLKTAIQGTANLLEQSHKAGVTKFVFTSSVTTVLDFNEPEKLISDHTFTEEVWNPSAKECFDNIELFDAYCTAKVVSEKALWKFADEHPEMDVVSILPTWVYGPLTLGFNATKGNWSHIATISLFRFFVCPPEKFELPPHQMNPPPMAVDVRDVAKAHVLALNSQLGEFKGHKRMLVSGPRFTWKDAIEHLAATRPELKSRLPDTSKYIEGPLPTIDTARSKQILGMEYISDWRKTVDDTVDTILAIEKQWGEECVVNSVQANTFS